MRKATILVVDDDPHYVQLVRVNMQASGYRVLTASDGLGGLKILETEQPDLVILDIMMPFLDGYETCRRIREFSLVPIIMLTARGEQEHKVRGLRAGADDYVTKPFGADELLARVEAVLRRSMDSRKPQRKGDFTCGELTIDFAHHRALVAGADVGLSATEFKLLSQLVANAGFVVSQEDLLRKVWGQEYSDDREILKVCISRLRQKIEQDPHHPQYIRTRRGIGYSFVASPPHP
ncbi:MAG: response regulator transcription factor [Chloroflexota bacterium]|nr:MAG: response regulator transcription factor [Chloroflexota bacterium]